MDNVQQAWNGARTALTPAEWLDRAEARAGNFQVVVDGQPLMHYPVSYDVALPAFVRYARRGGRVRLIEERSR